MRIEHYQPGERFVVKMQRPTATNDPKVWGQCFIYDEHRIVCQFLPFDKDLEEIMDGELKRYFWAFFLEDGSTLNFWTEDGLPDQDPGW